MWSAIVGGVVIAVMGIWRTLEVNGEHPAYAAQSMFGGNFAAPRRGSPFFRALDVGDVVTRLTRSADGSGRHRDCALALRGIW